MTEAEPQTVPPAEAQAPLTPAPLTPARLRRLLSQCLLRDRQPLSDRLRRAERSGLNQAELERLWREAEASMRLVAARRRRPRLN